MNIKKLKIKTNKLKILDQKKRVTDKSLVSIITPSYNSSRFIGRMIDSIISQSYTNWELVITDDSSIDNTTSIIKKYIAKDSRIKLFQLEENQGAGFARNNSIRFSNGRFIAFCDSDDVWFENKLELQLNFMNKTNTALTYSGYQELFEDGKLGKIRKAKSSINYKEILRNNYIHCFTAMYDSFIIGKVYMPEIRKRQDWLMWIKILKDIKICKGISDSLGYYTIRKDSVSSNKFELLFHNWNIYKNELNFNFLKSSFFIFKFLIFYILKKIK